MNDQIFLQKFEDASLTSFSHADHIRMAWLYLRRDSWTKGYPQIQAGLKNFALSHGQADKYHETITCFWAKLVQHCIDNQAEIEEFAIFSETFPILFSAESMQQHYSKEVLSSATARNQWLEPDKIPMPTIR